VVDRAAGLAGPALVRMVGGGGARGLRRRHGHRRSGAGCRMGAAIEAAGRA